MEQGNDKLHQIAQEIKEFCYEFDYWDFMEYYEEQQETEYIDWDGVIEDIVTEIESNPAHFIDYLERWEQKKADEIAAKIKALMTA